MIGMESGSRAFDSRVGGIKDLRTSCVNVSRTGAALLTLILNLMGLVIPVATASAQTVAWAARSPSPGALSCGNTVLGKSALAVDAIGNSYVTGCAPNGANDDYLTVKFDAAGALVWQVRYNGSANSHDKAYALSVDASGNVYVTGTSNGASGGDNYATIKYNSVGVQQWTAIYNGTGNGNDYATALSVDASGNVYVTGQSRNASGNTDYGTVKYNSSGVQQWVAIYAGSGSASDWATDVSVDASGNVYVTGGSVNAGSYNDYATLKYNSAGVQQWAAIYNGAGNSADQAYALSVDASGNVYVTGTSNGASGRNNYATIKYNGAGVQQWAAIYNGTGNDYDAANALSVDASGNVYVTGVSRNAGGNDDYATIKYNSAGVQQWVAIFNGTGDNTDQAYALLVDAGGNVYVTGHSYIASSRYDYATIKYNSAGLQQWELRFNGTLSSDDAGYALAFAVDGSVFVAGTENRYFSFSHMTVQKIVETQSTTTTIASVTPATSVVGESIAVAFTVSAASGTPTGTMIVSDDLGASCGPIILVAGTGSCALAPIAAGSRTLTANYTPADALFASSIGSVSHAVSAAATTLAITAHSPQPSIPGDTINVTVDLSVLAPGAGAPSGTISVTSSSGDACTIAWPGATSCALTLSAPSPWTLTASYAGNANFTASTAASVTHAVNTYAITLAPSTNGSITLAAGQSFALNTVPHGTQAVFDVVPASGYRIAAVTGCGGVLAGSTYTTSAITSGCTISASFNRNPVAQAGVLSLLEDAGATVGTLVASDDDTLTFSVVTPPTRGSITITNATTGAYTYTPTLNANGSDSFTFKVNDGGVDSNIATIAITITPVNDAPSLTLGSNPNHAAGTTGAQIVASFANFDAGPADEDATQSVDDYLIDSISDATNVLTASSLDIANNGTLTYTLTGTGGTASISVRVRDNGGTANSGIDTSTAATFTITVAPSADLQIAKDDGVHQVQIGHDLVYAITVTNAGPNAVIGATLTDTLPASLINAEWACLPLESNTPCPPPPHDAGIGNLLSLIDLPVGKYLRFDLSATVQGAAGANVTNTASIAAASGVVDLTTSNNSATDSTLIVPEGIFIHGFESPPAPLTVPAASEAQARAIGHGN